MSVSRFGSWKFYCLGVRILLSRSLRYAFNVCVAIPARWGEKTYGPLLKDPKSYTKCVGGRILGTFWRERQATNVGGGVLTVASLLHTSFGFPTTWMVTVGICAGG